MRTFLKGFCIGLLCLSLLGLAWFLVLQPGLTNGGIMPMTVFPFAAAASACSTTQLCNSALI